MQSFLFYVLVSVFLQSVNSFQHSLPPDIYAYPKYRVAFLRDLSPLENKTALRWLSDGLRGGQLEFLGHWQPSPPKEIESGETHVSGQDSQVPIVSEHQLNEQEHVSDDSPSPVLELLRLGPRSYLCLIPPPPSVIPEPSVEDQTPITPTHSWSLLQPLSGTCLYHRQAWFTYSYCHNVHVRQFRELPATHHHTTGARVVEEDPEWESYTLGRSPLADEATDRENIPHDKLAIANIELAHQEAAGQRYLVQRWTDGTPCDKTGQPREVEIQFHCSMTMTDTIMFVKETRTCEYVLVIHTPRLCGEPGFKSHLEQVPEAEIQCREILNDDESDSSSSSSSSKEQEKALKFKHPFRRIPRPPLVPVTSSGEQSGSSKKGSSTANRDALELFQRAVDQLFGQVLNTGGDGEGVDDQNLHLIDVDGGELDDANIFVVLDLDGEEEQGDNDDGGGAPEGRGSSDPKKITLDRKSLAKLIREAGLDFQWEDHEEDASEEGGGDLTGNERAERAHDEL